MGRQVVAYDNFSTGQERFLENALAQRNFALVRGDLLDVPALTQAMQGVELVFHLAANADVRFGTEHPRKDLEQNTIATFNVLEAMRANGVRRIAFSSTGSIYGEPEVFPTPERAPFPVQTSLYGASKLAGEGLIQAYCEAAVPNVACHSERVSDQKYVAGSFQRRVRPRRRILRWILAVAEV